MSFKKGPKIFEETKNFKSDFFKGLEEKVREALQDGWQPLGAPYDYETGTITSQQESLIWTKAYQAMVKYA